MRKQSLKTFIWLISIVLTAYLTWYFSRRIPEKNKKKTPHRLVVQNNSTSLLDQIPFEETLTAVKIPQPLNGILSEEILAGEGPTIEPGKKARIAYVGRLPDGKIFDSTIRRSQAFEIEAGAGKTLPGLEIGIMGMHQGSRRRIFVPPQFGYGEKGAGGGLVPPNSILIYDVEVLEIGL
jgi:FKBP-type peptidyl-prolyl cis-trans isomerase